jgi:hypothetical protein
MKRHLLGVAVLALTVGAAAPAPAATRTYFGFQIGIGGAPPPPPVVVPAPPPVTFVPEGGVYVVHDPHVGYDEFVVGSYWYAFYGGYWYRAPSFRGPFRVVDVRVVPRGIFSVPAAHWRHYPPGLARWRSGPRVERYHGRR